MANKNIFNTLFHKNKNQENATDTHNQAGGIAYAFTPEHALAQFATTGCFNNTYYANAADQLDQVRALCEQVSPKFIAQTAIYAREKGAMKDMPAFLLAILAQKDVALCAQIFERVIDNGKMLRNFVQMLRSGATGRKSLGTRPKKLVQNWLLNANEKQLLNAAIGNAPSLADVVKMVHPKPREAWQAAWFAWLIGREYRFDDLPPITQSFELYKQNRSGKLPDVPFQMLTSLDLDTGAWTQIALNGSWQQVRQSLNTFQRHGVFDKSKNIRAIAEKISDKQAVAKSRVLPYQLLTAFQAAYNLPNDISNALQDAMEYAVENVPVFKGNIVACPDVSGSMQSPATGYRGSATSKTRCIDVAALVSAAVLRQNPKARILPFENIVVGVKINPRDSIMTNAEKLARIGGGGTTCSAPLAKLNAEKARVDLLIMVSDNESWADREQRFGSKTSLQKEWDKLKQRCPNAKLVCLDIQPNATTQAQNRDDILNIGGFSDHVFGVIGAFAEQGLHGDAWVKQIQAIEL
ncbi:RNA-binding protein [Wielerella bovis]|uniref:RNA-binding protein n=1 Tax=Wielerella bovis TaxID=2917790 RepID=UPI002019CC5F|nr:RNA-binding protein [Wielerella bovis]ULJ60713.1 RNA-binding protein [Wielerella bovis]